MLGVQRIEVALPLVGSIRRGHAVAVLSALSSGCAGPFSSVDPAGPAADATRTLAIVLLAMAALAFVVILGVFAASFQRRRSRKVPLRLFLIGGGLVFPLTLLTIATVYGVVLGERITGFSARPALEVEAQARQWRWSFVRQGPAGPLASDDLLDIPTGQSVAVTVTSADVIHSFWVPRLAGKVDAIPGTRNRILIRADVPGRYGGICAEFCGTGHAGMGFSIVAHDEAGWAALTAREGRP